MRYDAEIDPNTHSTSHNLIIELVGHDQRVLDLGCATGAVGAALKTNGCQVVGVEFDPEAAAKAREVLDRVVVADLDDPASLDQFDASTFDVVVFGDVLEHLKTPADALRRARRLLTPGGAVVISIPNVAHGAVRLNLLAGRFDYQSLGLLDRTHLHLFTRQSVQELLQESGFAAVEVDRTTSDVLDTEIPLDPAEFGPDIIEAVRQSGEASTYQFVVKARPIDEIEGLLASSSVWGTPGATPMQQPSWVERDRLAQALVLSVARLSAALPPGHGPRPTDPARGYECRLDAAQDPEAYRRWLDARVGREHARRQGDLERLQALSPSRISVLVPVYRPEPEILRRCVESVRRQTYQDWQLCLCDDGSGDPELLALLESVAAQDQRVTISARKVNGGISAATNSAAAMATGEFIALLDQDDEFDPGALAAAARALAEDGEIDFLYTDEDKLEPDGTRSDPFFKPDWSPDQLMAHMYLGHMLVFRRTLFEEVGGFRSEFDGSQDYDLALRLTERARKVAHVPVVAYHWRKITGSTAQDYRAKPGADLAARAALTDALHRRGESGSVESGLHEGTFRIRRTVPDKPLVSVIVPFHDGAELLRRCVTSLQERAGYENWEAILVDNNSWEPETRAILSRLTQDSRCRVLPYLEPFNWAAINNHAAKFAQGKHLLFLNADIEGRSHGWLEALVEQSQRTDIGAVGGRLLYPDGRVQHAGVVMGLGGGVAWHAFCFLPGDQPGYFGQAKVVRNYCAVTGACMMVRKEVFNALDGFDQRLPVAYNDIDFCLRLREAGYRIVYTPFSELIHEESAVRGHASREPVETAIMWQRWEPIIRRDPYFNPNLDPLRSEHTLDAGFEEDPWQNLVSTVEKWLNRSGTAWPPSTSSNSPRHLGRPQSSSSSSSTRSGATSTPMPS